MDFYIDSAQAEIYGSEDYPDIKGYAKFTLTNKGTLVTVAVNGLPYSGEECADRFFAMHIHSGDMCSGNSDDPFAGAGTHYNPEGCPHPRHAGDLPPLISAKGRAAMSFMTDNFTPAEIIGKTIIIHSKPDDFTTQPAGNSGVKIACGEIREV